MFPGVVDDSPSAINAQAEEHGGDVLGRVVVRVVGHAVRQDAGACDFPLTDTTPGIGSTSGQSRQSIMVHL